VKTNLNKILAAGIALAVIAAVIVAALSPPEQQLGDFAKLIYVHAGLVFVSLLLVAAVGALGLLYLVTNRKVFYVWSLAAKPVTLIFWAVYLGISILAMKLTWNEIIWNEPRFLLAASVFLILCSLYLVSLAVHAPKAVAFLNLATAVVVWWLVAKVPAVMHPTSNPIRTSSSGLIKLDSLLIFLFILAAAALSVTLAQRLQRG